jgi:hypothetical protein
MEPTDNATHPTQPTTAMGASDIADERRRAATAKHTAAIATIDALFDRVDQLRIARDRLTGIKPAPFEADPIRDAQAVIDAAHQLEDALSDLRQTAERAAKHRSRSELANDIGTRQSALFPRNTTNARRSRGASPTTGAAGISDDHAHTDR